MTERVPSMHCSLENRKKEKNRTGGGGSDSETPRQLKRLDNKRTSEQTGLTAGPGSVREAVKITRPRGGGGRGGGGGGGEGEGGEGRGGGG